MDKPIPGAQHMMAWFCRSDFVLFGSSRMSSAVPTVRTWLQTLVAGGVGNHQLKQSRVPNFGRRIDGNSDRCCTCLWQNRAHDFPVPMCFLFSAFHWFCIFGAVEAKSFLLAT